MAGPSVSSSSVEQVRSGPVHQQQHHVEEEYTDYSCSTAIERLSRDVETVLRGWHVDRGSDRHVSIINTTSNKQKSTKTQILLALSFLIPSTWVPVSAPHY